VQKDKPETISEATSIFSKMQIKFHGVLLEDFPSFENLESL